MTHYNPTQTQLLLNYMQSHAVTYSNMLISLNVIHMLHNGADPRATYPNGDSVITRAIRVADLLVRHRITFGDRMAAVRVLLERGALLTDEDITTLTRLVGMGRTEDLKGLPYETIKVKILAILEVFSILEMDGGYQILQNMAEYAGVIRPSTDRPSTEFGGKKKNRKTKQKKHNRQSKTRRR